MGREKGETPEQAWIKQIQDYHPELPRKLIQEAKQAREEVEAGKATRYTRRMQRT